MPRQYILVRRELARAVHEPGMRRDSARNVVGGASTGAPRGHGPTNVVVAGRLGGSKGVKRRCGVSISRTWGITTCPLERPMRILLVDRSKERMALLRRVLAGHMPGVEVTEYDVEQRGMPPASFDWSLYEVVIVREDLGDGESGIRWLENSRTKAVFPASVMIVEPGETKAITRAKGAGADAVLTSADLNAGNLLGATKAALARSRSRGRNDRLERSRDSPSHLFHDVRSGEAQLRPQHDYRDLRLIGQGGMSRVYLAERVEDKRPVVLKVLETESAAPELLKRFIHEAKLISSINSPWVVKILEHAFTQKHGFIAMEFFSGGDLKQRIEQGIRANDALLYLMEIAHALEAIHAVGIVHRDLKPANIMFREDDSLALADFGVSMRTDMATELTAPGTLVGTLYYMSPEQIGARPLDSRTDLYSLGVVFFEMLTNRKPFMANSPKQLIEKHLRDEIPRLPDNYRSLQPLLNRLLAKDPDHRFQSASDVITYLVPICKAIRKRR